MTSDQRTQQAAPEPQEPIEARDAEGRPRPDLTHPRGNPAVEPIDVERGEGKLDRVLGW